MERNGKVVQLRAIGAEPGKGFFIRPMEADAFVEHLRAERCQAAG